MRCISIFHRSEDVFVPLNRKENLATRQILSSICTDAARRGAPKVIQVADRYHLVANLRDALQKLLDRKRTGCVAKNLGGMLWT